MVSYFGLVDDDFAARHDDGAIMSMSELNKQLIFAVLFDEPLLINDGHIINSPVVYDAVLNRDASPLRRLVQGGYIQILTRNKSSLDTLAERMADYGITKAQERLREPDYDALKRVLTKWSGTLTKKSFRLWPRKDTSAVFEKLAVGALDKAVDRVREKAHQTQLTQFKTEFTGRDRRNRTTWEEIALSMRSSGLLSYEVQRSILHMANEA